MNRRIFITQIGWGLSAWAFAPPWGLPSGWLEGPPINPARGRHFLSDSELPVIAQLGRILFPSGGALAPGWEETGLVDFVDEYWFGWSLEGQRRIRVSIRLIEWGVPFFLFRWSRFSRFDSRAARQDLTEISNSPMGYRQGIYRILHHSLSIGYYGHPAVAAQLGYQPVCNRPAPYRDPLLEAESASPSGGLP